MKRKAARQKEHTNNGERQQARPLSSKSNRFVDARLHVIIKMLYHPRIVEWLCIPTSSTYLAKQGLFRKSFNKTPCLCVSKSSLQGTYQNTLVFGYSKVEGNQKEGLFLRLRCSFIAIFFLLPPHATIIMIMEQSESPLALLDC